MEIWNNTKLFFLSLIFSTSSHCNPFEIIKDLDIGARASLKYDSNLFGVSDNVYQNALGSAPSNDEIVSPDDFVINFSPSLHFTKSISLLKLTGSAGVSLTRYIKNTDKSSIVPVTTLSLDFDDTLSLQKRLSNNAKVRFYITFDLGQYVDTSILEQDLVSYTYFTTNFNVRYNHSAKFGLGGGTNLSIRDYQTGAVNESYNDLKSIPLSLQAFYIYSEKLDLFTDYTTTLSISEDSSTNAADSQSHSISVGLNGEYSSKLSGRISFGYSWIDYESTNLESSDNLISSVDLSWTHNSKTSSSFFINRQFSPSAQGSSTFNTNLGARVNHKLTDRFRGFANTNYSIVNYTFSNGDKSELDQITLGAGVDYNWSDSIMIGSSYNFSFINNKDEDYDRHTFEIYASGRF